MKRTLRLISIFTIATLSAQNNPFNCVYNAYLFHHNDFYSIYLASENSYLVAKDVTSGSINAAAYNPTDSYIWGSLNTPAKTIVRIGQDFQTTSFYVDEFPTSGRYVGDVSANGIYYLKGGGTTTYYKIDVNPSAATYTELLSTETLSQNISIHDWAFNAVDNNLYAVDKNTNIRYRIDPATSSVQSLGEVPILAGLNYTYGAVYFDLSGRFYVIQRVQDLNGTITMNSNLFAFGSSSASDVSTQQDALHLADEPWGIDYLEENVTVDSFTVESSNLNYTNDAYQIERQPSVSGQAKGTINLFRHVLPGDQTLDVSNYETLEFNILNTQPIEAILMQEGLLVWNNRLRITIPVNTTENSYTISFDDFVDDNGNLGTIADVKTIVFSFEGDYHNYVPFTTQVTNVAFGMESTLSVETFEITPETNKLSAIPNPMTTQTNIHFTAKQSEDVQFIVYDQVGKVVYTAKVKTENGHNKIPLNPTNLRSGLYFCKIIGSRQTYKTIKLIVQ